MKHESNDTPPFAPDDPISRSLFVRPNLIERLCASALRLCLLVCIPAAASVFLISLADSAEAACTSEPSQHYEVTTLIADHPVQTSSDPDFEEILKANARLAVESGEWSRRVKRKEETLIQWMRSPVFPEFRPMAVKTTLIRRPTGLSVEDIRRAELFNDVSRLLLFFDSRAGGQVNFAMRMLSTASFAIRPVVAAGSVAFAQEKLGTRVWADQGSVLTRRLGLNHWPALVKLTPSEISVILSSSMFELPTLNSLDAIDRQQVHYATIQLNGPRFPIDTADYFNLVIHRALHEAGLTVEMLCQELRLDMSAVEDMLQSKVFCPDELALITFHLRLDTAFMMEAHAALTLPSYSKPSTVVAEPADTLKECVVKHGYKTLNHFSEVHGFDPIAMNTISLHRRCTDSTGMKLAQALNVSLEEIRTVLVASDFDPVPKSLKLLIKKRNYTTYKEFAAAAGLTEHHIMKIAKTRTCTTTCAVKLCKALGITEDELAASLLIAEPRHKHGSKLETPSKEAMEEVASTKARRKKDESDTEEECGTSTVSLKRPRRSSK